MTIKDIENDEFISFHKCTGSPILIESHVSFTFWLYLVVFIIFRLIFYFSDKHIPRFPNEHGQVSIKQIHHSKIFMVNGKRISVSYNHLVQKWIKATLIYGSPEYNLSFISIAIPFFMQANKLLAQRNKVNYVVDYARYTQLGKDCNPFFLPPCS